MKKKNLTVIEIRLTYLRSINNLTQKELAEELQISRATINAWENGYKNISLKGLIKISYFYQTPIDYIIGLTTDFNPEDYNYIKELDLKYLGNMLHIIRKKESLKQTDFAAKVHSNRSNISFYETGTKTISTSDLKEICNTFGYSCDWCVGNTKKCIRRTPNITIKPEEIKEYMEI